MTTVDKWQIAAAIATIVQTIAVIISLYFIWRQLQQQTQQMEQQTELTKIANTQELVNLSSPFNLELIKDPAVAALWVSGSKDYENFDRVKKYQYKSLLIWWLLLHENIFYQNQKSLLDENIYASWDYDLRNFVRNQPLEPRWAELKDAFQSEFRNYVSSVIEESTRAGYTDATALPARPVQG